MNNFLQIESWLKKHKIDNYTINSDMSVDVVGSVNLRSKRIDCIEVNFNKVSGDFDCNYNDLTTLAGSPKIVGGDFQCGNNQLSSLEYAPQIVGGQFSCENNKINSLQFCPQSIGENFNCNGNKLKSLEFFPVKVNGDIFLNNNKIEKLDDFKTNFSGIIYVNTLPKSYLEEHSLEGLEITQALIQAVLLNKKLETELTVSNSSGKKLKI